MNSMVKKIMQVTRSMSGGKDDLLESNNNNSFYDFNSDVSIAIEYTGSPVHHSLPKAVPVDVDRIPTAKVAPTPVLLNVDNMSLPVVEPIVRNKVRANDDSNYVVKVASRLDHRHRNNDNDDDDDDGGGGGSLDVGFGGNEDMMKCEMGKISEVCFGGSLDDEEEGMGKCCDNVIESSGTLGFSDSRDHSHELSESSDMVDAPLDCKEIEAFENFMNPNNWNSTELNSTPVGFSAEVSCDDDEEEEEEEEGEALECRRTRKKQAVTFCDEELGEELDGEDSVNDEESVASERERPVAEKPPKRGACYHCHKGNRLTEKEACIVCDAKYCRNCILRVMGSMPEGRKCLSCISFPVDESKRRILGKSPRLLKGLFSASEVKQIMNSEVSCPANQLSPEYIVVNDVPLCLDELMLLRSCPNPPKNLRPGRYWYDRVAGFWGKVGHKPCQIITPQLSVGGDRIRQDVSSGNTDILINNREITKAELWMLQSAGVECTGNLSFWVQADGTYTEEGMNHVKGKIWGRKRTKLVCSLLSLPTPESPNTGGKLNRYVDGAHPGCLEHKTLCKILLVGNDHSGTSTIYKQARVLYDLPFSEDERQNIKSMIQSKLYGYLGRLLEGREQFEEESLLELQRKQSNEPSSSAVSSEVQSKTVYSIGTRLKDFSDWLIQVMVSGNLEIIFPAATREYAPYVEELWKDAAIMATYDRKDELELPRVASYFLDRAVEIAKANYEPSETDILYAEGITSSIGLASMDFSFSQTAHDGYQDPAEQPTDPVTRYQLIRVPAKSLGENCKWVQMFEGVGIVMFCVSLAEYDEYALNSRGVLVNYMLESKRLFESIVTHPKFEDMNFLLVLNKFDLLEEKIDQVPLTCCEWFQDFNPVNSRHQRSRSHGNNVASQAQSVFHYVAVKFMRLFKSLTGRKLYVCPVTALEGDTVGTALRYATEIVKWEGDKISFGLNDSSCESIENENSSYS